MIYFPKISAQHATFCLLDISAAQNLPVSNELFPKSKIMTYFNTSKPFNASPNPGQVGSYKQALILAQLCACVLSYLCCALRCILLF